MALLGDILLPMSQREVGLDPNAGESAGSVEQRV